MDRSWQYLQMAFSVLLAGCMPVETHTPSMTPTSTMILPTCTNSATDDQFARLKPVALTS